MGRALVVVALLAGCVDDSVQHCGAVICPTTQVCVDDTRCVGKDALCSGSAGDACTASGVAGRCTDHGDLRVCDPAVCGDGVIDSVLHEDCDGSAAFAAQCVDLGYDLGRPACAADCTFDVAGCTRFGWDRTINASIYAFWTDGTIVAYGQHDPDATVVTGGGFNAHEPRFIDSLVGGGGHIYGITASTVPVELKQAAIVDFQPPWAPGAPLSLAADATGALYVAEQCNIWKYDGVMTWTELLASPSLCPTLVAVAPDGEVYFVGLQNVVYELVSGSPSGKFQTSGVIHALRVVSNNEIYAASDQGLWMWPGTGAATQLAYGDLRTIAVAQGVVYASYADGSAVRWDGKQLDRFTPPTAALTDDGAGGLYAFTGPVYRYSGVTFGDLPPVPGNASMTSIVRFADDSVMATSSDTLWHEGAQGENWAPGPGPAGYYRALAGTSSSELVLATDAGLGNGSGAAVTRLHGGTWTTTTPPGQPVVDGVWMDSDGSVQAAGYAGSDGFIGVQDATDAWIEHASEPGCDFHGVDHGIAVGACGGVASVWRYDGTSWSELHREMTIAGALRAVKVLPGGDIFAVGDSGAVWLTAGAWNVDASVHGRSIDGSDSDLWVAGAFTDIEHWDGHVWSKVTTHALGPMVIAAPARRLLMPGGGVGHVVLLR